MLRTLPALAAVPLVLAFGVAEGLWTDRWHQAPDVALAAGRLAAVPLTVGEWQGEDQVMDARVRAKAEIAGYLLRQYVHRPTGATVSVLLVCGRPGPVSVHTPDVCYGGGGYGQIGSPARHTVDPPPPVGQRGTLDVARGTRGPVGPASFWVGTFAKGAGVIPDRLRVLWAWTETGDWTAPDAPRLAFARAPVLYKLYVVRPLVRLDEPVAADPGEEFLRLFLPHVHQALFPGAADPLRGYPAAGAPADGPRTSQATGGPRASAPLP